MNAPPATPLTAVLARRRRRWWLRGVLLLAALVIAAPLGLFGYLTYATRHDWEEAEASADRTDPRWRLMDIEADRAKIPDQENSALAIIAITGKTTFRGVTDVPNYEAIFAKLPPTAQLNGKQIDIIRTELAKIAGPLEEARRLKDMPRGRFPIVYDDNFINTLISEQQNARRVADWLQHDAYELAQDERIDKAMESCRAILNLGRSLDGEPFLISHLIRDAMQSIATETLERVLAQGQASDDHLRAVQAALEQESKDSDWLAAVRGERAGLHFLFDNMRSGKVKPISLAGGGGRGRGFAAEFNYVLVEAFPITSLKDYPDYLRNMTRCVGIARLPIHERGAKLEEWEAAVQRMSNPVIGLLTPAMMKIHQTECRNQAMLRTAAVALACERYRLQHKATWPATLNALVEAKLLSAIPADPIDNQPLRYRQTKDGIVIYSIGIDKTDNHGHIDRENRNGKGVDIGFRLWHVDARRQPALSPLEVEERR